MFGKSQIPVSIQPEPAFWSGKNSIRATTMVTVLVPVASGFYRKFTKYITGTRYVLQVLILVVVFV
jgi:hypothetical protein